MSFVDTLWCYSYCRKLVTKTTTKCPFTRCQTGCSQSTESAVSLLCPSAVSYTGRNLSPHFLPCVVASSGRLGTQPSEGNSAPVDTRGENTKHLTKYLGLLMWQKAKDEPSASHSDNTPDTEVS